MGIAGIQLYGARVAVFDDPDFVSTGGNSGTESADNIRETLEEQGAAVGTFIGTSANAFEKALRNVQVLVIPELDQGDLAAALSNDAKDVIREFVESGGTLIVSGIGNNHDVKLLNKLFGTDLVDGDGYVGDFTKTQTPDGSTFASGPATINDNIATYTIDTTSMPGNSFNLYGNGNNSAAFAMPKGLGQVIYLGWDWYDALPLGSQDGGWLEVLFNSQSLRSGNTLLAGGTNDVLTKATGATTNKADLIDADSGDDTVEGAKGFDLLYGAGGDDVIDGGKGNDLVSGGEGKDKLTGGKGGDQFTFDADISDVDKVFDFKHKTDVIVLSRNIFTALDLGELDPSAFHVGTEATDLDHRIIYDDETGKLFYDEDGTGLTDPVLFARLDKHLNLSAKDFYVELLVV